MIGFNLILRFTVLVFATREEAISIGKVIADDIKAYEKGPKPTSEQPFVLDRLNTFYKRLVSVMTGGENDHVGGE